jgi:hypothetical protein
LVCLQRVHVSCPRYARGTVLATETTPAPKVSEQRLGRGPLLTLVGIGLVILAVGTLLSGLLGLPPFGSSKPAVQPATAPASIVAASSQTASAVPTDVASPSDSAAASAVPSASVAPVATPKPTPTRAPTPAASATWPPGATASRMSLLTACTGQANCYQYTVRGAGSPPAGNGSAVADTLAGIAQWFGVDLNTVRQMNPSLGGSDAIHPGETLKIPSPTR